MKGGKIKIVILVILVLCAGFLGYEYYRYYHRKIMDTKKQIIYSVPYEASAMASFYTYGKYMFFCTKDGCKLLDVDENTIWDEAFTMTNPYMSGCGSVVAVIDKSAKLVKVFNTVGKMYEIQEDKPITFANINKNGYASIITSESDDVYCLNIYDPNSKKSIFSGNFTVDTGIPVSTAFSNDNKTVAVSFVDINDIKMVSRVAFYSIGISNQDETQVQGDSFFSSFIKENQLIGILKFLDNGNLISISDSQMVCSQTGSEGGEAYKELWAVDFKNNISAVDFPNDSSIAIGYGNPLINEQDAFEKNTVVWYGSDGVQQNIHSFKKDIAFINSGFKATIIGGKDNFKAISSKGKLLWDYNSSKEIRDIRFIGTVNKVVAVSDKKADIMLLSGKVADSEETEVTSYQVTTESTTEQITQEESQTSEVSTEQATAKEKSADENDTPNQSEPVKEETNQQTEKNESVQSEPVTQKSEPVTQKSEPVQSEPVQSEPVQSELVQSEPVQSEPVQSEPVQSEPVQSEPVQSEPVMSDTADDDSGPLMPE